MMFFTVFSSLIVTQRLIELIIAKNNEKWMKEQGGIEYGRKHYHVLVIIHVCFFLSLLLEFTFFEKSLNPLWPFVFSIFLIAQIGRFWVIHTLGRFWNTKIIVLPQSETISKGPYKYIRHPNYLIVTLELIIIPVIFNAYFTLICFFILNQIILSVRIPFEEQVLLEKTNYQFLHKSNHRFLPKLKK